MLNASFCGVAEITVAQAVALQYRNMTLVDNRVTEVPWGGYSTLTTLPRWLRTLDKVVRVDISGTGIEVLPENAFPRSTESVFMNGHSVASLRPGAFQGAPHLRYVTMRFGLQRSESLHLPPGLFGDNKVVDLYLAETALRFDAQALFPGDSGEHLQILELQDTHLTSLGGNSGNNVQGLSSLAILHLSDNNFGDNIQAGALSDLKSLKQLFLRNAGIRTLPARVFSGKNCIPTRGLSNFI